LFYHEIAAQGDFNAFYFVANRAPHVVEKPFTLRRIGKSELTP
jgi:hypothetical protein